MSDTQAPWPFHETIRRLLPTAIVGVRGDDFKMGELSGILRVLDLSIVPPKELLAVIEACRFVAENVASGNQSHAQAVLKGLEERLAAAQAKSAAAGAETPTVEDANAASTA
ncbi:MAG: hypothetical protein AAB686_03765 [Patescibacteria group bacterium]